VNSKETTMTNTRVTRFSILQTGKFLGVLYGFVAVILVPFALLSLVAGNREGSGVFCFMIVLYPLIGFIGGILGAALYNLAAHLVGGLELELELQSGGPGSADAGSPSMLNT
jgi:hypothetical protein